MARLSRSAAPERLRALALAVHRYVGLVIAAFLVVAGLTGSVIAFYPDLDALLNPELFQVQPPYPGARPLDPFTVRERLQEQLPSSQGLSGVILHADAHRPSTTGSTSMRCSSIRTPARCAAHARSGMSRKAARLS